MRRLSLPAAGRRSATALAVAGLFAGAVLTAAPAHADGPVFTLGGPAEVGLRPYPATGKPQTTTVDVTVNNPSEDVENGDFDGEYTVTFDLSALAGVADVTFGDTGSSDCKITGTTGVCTDYGVWAGLSSVAELKVSAAKGSKLGATGDIKVSGTAEGATFTPFATKVTVGGPDLVMKPLNLKADVKPGQAQRAPITFANAGTSAVDGVLLTLLHSHGIEIPERFSNCEYSDGVGPGNEFDNAYTTVVCALEGPFEPGAVYELEKPFTVKAADHAFIEDFIYRVNENSPKERAAQRAGAAFTPGTGGVLGVKKQAAPARSADLDPWNNQQEQGIRAKNTADFAAYGVSVEKAAVGETVKAGIGFRNQGPAWIGYLRSGESIGLVDVKIPQGAKVTAKPKSCNGVTASGGERDKQLGAPRYICQVGSVVLEDADFALPFELTIEKVVTDATGTVTVRNWHEPEPALQFDPNMANNTAKLVLNGKDSGTTTGGTSGGSTTGGSTGGSTGGDSAQSTGGTAAGSGTSTGGTAEGGLASTGSTALLTASAAAVALAAGGFLFVAVRRRRATTGA